MGNGNANTRFFYQAVAEHYEVFRKGWPDFVIRKGKTIIFVEVKEQRRLYKETIKPSQVEMFQLLGQLGIEVQISTNGELDTLTPWADWYYYDKQRNRLMKERGYVPECSECERRYDDPNHAGPRHEANSGCESGKKAHCTCDTCF